MAPSQADGDVNQTGQSLVVPTARNFTCTNVLEGQPKQDMPDQAERTPVPVHVRLSDA